jgi:hypothetical protein
MKRNRKGARRREQAIRLWDYAEARRATAYLTSIMRTLRESQLAAARCQLAARRLEQKPGVPDRTALIEREEQLKEGQRAEARFREALEELHALDVYCLDPVQGEALIPFVCDKELAWFVFDLFASDLVASWRFQTDPLEKRRPIAEALKIGAGA